MGLESRNFRLKVSHVAREPHVADPWLTLNIARHVSIMGNNNLKKRKCKKIRNDFF